MSSKRRTRRAKTILSHAAIGVAATAAALKATLSTPLGAAAAPELERIGHELNQKAQAVVATARPVLDRAEAQLQAALQVTPQPSRGSAGPAAPVSPAAPSSVGNSALEPIDTGAPTRANRSHSRALVRKILREAAARHGLDPKIVLALSYWESGWDQSRVSETGAVGLMQVQPATAHEAGPALLGRTVDITDPYDNADVGAAVFRQDLDAFRQPAMALTAYYQGPTSLRHNGMLPDTQAYVDGILTLASTMNP